MGLLESHVRHLAAAAGVPTQRSPPKPFRVIDQEEDELERVREADEVDLGAVASATVLLRGSRARRKRA